MVRLRFSEAARADIRAIYRQGVEGFGVGPADTYASGLRQKKELEYASRALTSIETVCRALHFLSRCFH